VSYDGAYDALALLDAHHGVSDVDVFTYVFSHVVTLAESGEYLSQPVKTSF
jgi:hypothetical protein